MREVLFRNLISQDTHKRDLLMSETMDHGGFLISTQKRAIHFIRDCIHIKDLSNFEDLKEAAKTGKPKKTHYCIIKRHDSRTGEDKLFCKIRGFLYIVSGTCVYRVVFVNSFKINVKKSTIN